jgi:hypothetical protein
MILRFVATFIHIIRKIFYLISGIKMLLIPLFIAGLIFFNHQILLLARYRHW